MKKDRSKEIIRDEDDIILFDPTDDEDTSEVIIQEYHKTSGRSDRVAKSGKSGVCLGNFDKYDYVEIRDEYTGSFFRRKRMNPKYIGRTLAVYDKNGELIWSIDDKKPNLVQKLKDWWKKTFSIVILLMCTLPITAQIYNPDKPMIVPFVIGVEDINQRVGDNHGHENLSEECGYVKIPKTYYINNGKSHGIIVVHGWGGNYQAFDSRCPVCFYEKADFKGGSIDPALPFSECNKCHASADNLKTQGTGQMFRYEFKGNGPEHMDGYVIREYEKNGKLYLWIYNVPNGLRDEWKSQPENQVVVEGCRKLYHGDKGW